MCHRLLARLSLIYQHLKEKYNMSIQWSEAAQVYDYFAKFTKQFAVRTVDLVKNEIEKERFTGQLNVLDVACGTGNVSIAFIKEMQDEANVLAVDLSEQMVNFAEQKILALNAANASVKVMDGQALSLDSDSFDVCTNLFSMMYFKDRAKGFGEMFRVLKPEGMVILGTWHAIQTVDIGRAIAKHYNAPHNPDLDLVLALADRSMITKEMTDAGFRDIVIERTTVYWVIEDKSVFENVMVHTPLFSFEHDREKLAKDFPDIMETVIPDYKSVSTLKFKCTANMVYGFK